MNMSTAADYHKEFFHGWVGAGQGLPMSLSAVRDSSVEFRNYQEDVKASGNASRDKLRWANSRLTRKRRGIVGHPSKSRDARAVMWQPRIGLNWWLRYNGYLRRALRQVRGWRECYSIVTRVPNCSGSVNRDVFLMPAYIFRSRRPLLLSATHQPVRCTRTRTQC